MKIRIKKRHREMINFDKALRDLMCGIREMELSIFQVKQNQEALYFLIRDPLGDKSFLKPLRKTKRRK